MNMVGSACRVRRILYFLVKSSRTTINNQSRGQVFLLTGVVCRKAIEPCRHKPHVGEQVGQRVGDYRLLNQGNKATGGRQRERGAAVIYSAKSCGALI